MEEKLGSSNKAVMLFKHWAILKTIAFEDETALSLAEKLGVCTKTIYRHTSYMEEIGFKFANKSRPNDQGGPPITVYSLRNEIRKVLQQLVLILEATGEDPVLGIVEEDPEEICGHDTLHGENVAGCKGCEQTLRDYEDELRESAKCRL